MNKHSIAREEASGRLPASIRRTQILDAVARDGFVSVSRVSEALGVSEMTIRRDLEALQEQGLVDRTFGGAVRRSVYESEEPAFDRRRRLNAEAKAEIARAAAALVLQRETIGIDVGTTALALAEELSARPDIRIFTNNLRAAMQISGRGGQVYIPGGQVREAEMSIIGALAVAQLRSYFLDRVFIGVSGFTESGFYDYSIEDTEVKRSFIEQAEQIVILCDATKFDHRSVARVAGVEEIDILITDAPPPPHLASILEHANVRVIVTDNTPDKE